MYSHDPRLMFHFFVSVKIKAYSYKNSTFKHAIHKLHYYIYCRFTAYYVGCSSAECQNTLFVNGEEIGVINIKRYLVAREVLRDYTYQFLYARFEKNCAPEAVVCDATTLSFRRKMVLRDDLVAADPVTQTTIQER